MADLTVDCVMTGALLLDEAYPGWWDAIDPDRLQMEEYHSCVIGQVARIDLSAHSSFELRGAWATAIRVLFPAADKHGVPHPDDPELFAEQCGFDLPSTAVSFDETDQGKWAVLRDYWVDVINERRRTHGADTHAT